MRQIMHRFEEGLGREEDIDLLYEIASNIAGRSFCALGDAAATPIRSAIDLFRSEFVDACTTPVAEQYPIAKSVVFSEVGVK